MPRIPNAAEDTVDNRLMAPSRRIARLEAELAESKREIERLRAELQSPTDDGERAALREIWQQSPAGPPTQGFTLWRWLRSLI
jgi:hypothetical protein